MFERYKRYIRNAFMHQWHLLALGASVGLAVILPMKDVSIPLIIAGEILFMSILCNNERFKRSVDAVDDAASTAAKQKKSQEIYNRLIYALDGDSQQAFADLRRRCEMITEARTDAPESTVDRMSDTHADGVNKLLWVFLKLLHTRCIIDKFLKSTDEASFDKLENRTRKRLETITKDEKYAQTDVAMKMIRSLEDTLSTVETRRANLRRAQSNREFIGMELDRIGAKLTTLAEMAVNRQDPSFITNEVDEVSKSVEMTEQAITELSTFAGMALESETAPQILDRDREPRRVRY